MLAEETQRTLLALIAEKGVDQALFEALRVVQRDACGCGLAVLAMITGKPYEEVKTGFADIERGVSDFEMDQYLAEHGFAVAKKFRHYAPLRKDREEPVVPFAFVHYCFVYEGDHTHCVLVLWNGLVIDPWPGRDKPRVLNDYRSVSIMAGVTELGA